MEQPRRTDGALWGDARPLPARAVVALPAARAEAVALGVGAMDPRRLDHPARRDPRGRHATGGNPLRRPVGLSLGAGHAHRRRLGWNPETVLAAAGRLDACLHRPALRAAPEALVSRLATAALRPRPADPRRQPRGRRRRAARCRRAGAAARVSRAVVRAGAHSRPRADRRSLLDRGRVGVRGARSAGRRGPCATSGNDVPASSVSTTASVAA